MSWGSLSTFDLDSFSGWGEPAPPKAGPADAASALANLAQVGAQVSDLISQNKFQKQMLREQKLATRTAKIEARRSDKFARRDQARASMLESRLNALQSITGARTKKTVVAVFCVLALSIVFAIAMKPTRKTSDAERR